MPMRTTHIRRGVRVTSALSSATASAARGPEMRMTAIAPPSAVAGAKIVSSFNAIALRPKKTPPVSGQRLPSAYRSGVMITRRFGSSPSLCVVTPRKSCRRAVQDAPLIRVHRLHGNGAAGRPHLGSRLARQPAQRLLPAGTISLRIERDALILFRRAVDVQRNEILQRVQRLAAPPDQQAIASRRCAGATRPPSARRAPCLPRPSSQAIPSGRWRRAARAPAPRCSHTDLHHSRLLPLPASRHRLRPSSRPLPRPPRPPRSPRSWRGARGASSSRWRYCSMSGTTGTSRSVSRTTASLEPRPKRPLCLALQRFNFHFVDGKRPSPSAMKDGLVDRTAGKLILLMIFSPLPLHRASRCSC